MTSKHTPGPWYVGEVSHPYLEIWDAPHNKNRHVLATVLLAGDDSLSHGIELTKNANARLISSSPTLYAACLAVKSRMEDKEHIPAEELYNMVCAAIKMVQGSVE